MISPEQAVLEIERLYQAYGHRSYDEVMTQVQHAVQSARQAQKEKYSEEVVLGAFLHDIGHLMVNEVKKEDRDAALYRHQLVGADKLRLLGFSDSVTMIVEQHVAAKRYLTAVDRSYEAGLSPASIHSLGFQGGPMNEQEISAFETLADKEVFLKMRTWDDLAKNPDDPDVDMSPYFEMAARHLSTHAKLKV